MATGTKVGHVGTHHDDGDWEQAQERRKGTILDRIKVAEQACKTADTTLAKLYGEAKALGVKVVDSRQTVKVDDAFTTEVTRILTGKTDGMTSKELAGAFNIKKYKPEPKFVTETDSDNNTRKVDKTNYQTFNKRLGKMVADGKLTMVDEGGRGRAGVYALPA